MEKSLPTENVLWIDYNDLNFCVVSFSCSVISLFSLIASEIFFIPPTISDELSAEDEMARELSFMESVIILTDSTISCMIWLR